MPNRLPSHLEAYRGDPIFPEIPPHRITVLTSVSGTVSGEHITYRFSPGPLAELLADCYAAKLNKSPMKYILIIEELNRANAASVFGDIFQLLDREKGTSIYEITAKSEFAHYLHSAVSHKLTDDTIDLPEDAFNKIKLPDNLYIWTTLNSADQGVFPLDSAFKRRWSCIYRDVVEVDPYSYTFAAPTGFEKPCFQWDLRGYQIADCTPGKKLYNPIRLMSRYAYVQHCNYFRKGTDQMGGFPW